MERVAEYTFTEDFSVTDEVKKAFEDYGYILLKGVLDSEEISKIFKAMESSDVLMKHAYGDVENGRKTLKVMWGHPGYDVTGMVARCEKVAGITEQLKARLHDEIACGVGNVYPSGAHDFTSGLIKLLGGEVYHYHTKVMMKNAGKGGRHVWHQDYGYWYKNGCLFPDMLTVFIALDPCKKENSCLQVLRGSHKCGRIDHVVTGEQYGADMNRVNEISKTCQHEYIEMNAGDALYFHCNVLHSSNDNDSNKRRWAFLTAFNKATNDPVLKHHHPNYTPLLKVPNNSIKECMNFTDVTGKEFIDPKVDTTLKSNYREH